MQFRQWKAYGPVLAFGSFLLAIGTVEAQDKLFEFRGSAAGDAFGTTVEMIGDMDGDGISEICVGAPGADSGGADSGEATVYSGYDGAVLYTHTGSAAGEQMGLFLAGPGDVTGDPFGDVAIAGTNRLTVYSGSDGSVWFDVVPPSSPLQGLAAAGDVNNDGTPDLAIGTPAAAYTLSGVDGTVIDTYPNSLGSPSTFATGIGDQDVDGWGDVVVVEAGTAGGILANIDGYSTKTGLTMYSFSTGGFVPLVNAAALERAGDINNDGSDDFIVGDPLEKVVSSYSGFLITYSGAIAYAGDDGAQVGFQIRPEFPATGLFEHEYGRSVSGAGDVDGDGFDDIMMGSSRDGSTVANTNEGSVVVKSGKNGLTMFELYGTVAGDLFGASSDGAWDVNGDGRPDFVIGAQGSDVKAADAGAAFVYSTNDLSLTTDVHDVSISGSGTQNLSLSAGAGNANFAYLLAGSLAGNAPGVPLSPSVTVPLNIDAWLLYSIANPNVPPYSSSFGFLDATGDASAAFTVPAGASASLAGLTFHHAYVAVNPITGGIVFASNSAPLTTSP